MERKRYTPVSLIISGSQSTLNTSPTMGSRTENGSRGSSKGPLRNLWIDERSEALIIEGMKRKGDSKNTTYPGTLKIHPTLPFLCNGKTSNVLTTLVRRDIPRPAIEAPVRTPPVAIRRMNNQ